MGMETSFFWFGVFSGSFGVRSIVLCKCSGNVLIGSGRLLYRPILYIHYLFIYMYMYISVEMIRLHYNAGYCIKK